MVALAVASNEQQLISYIARGLLVEVKQHAVEALPLREVGVRTAVGGVGLIDEAEICCGLP